jgi:general secretion pathway protein F
MPLPRALQRLMETRGGVQAAAADELLHILAEETPPRTKAASLGPLESSLLEAGRRSGHIAETLQLLATHFELLAQARRRIIRGAIYPLVVVHLAIILLTLPTLFQPEGGLGAYLQQAGLALVVLYLLLGGAWILMKTMWSLSCKFSIAESILCMVPVFGNLRRQWSAAQFATTLGIYFQSSAGVLGALRPAATASQSPAAMHAVPAISEAVRSGASFGEAVQSQNIFPEELVEAVFTGEETGRLREELTRCAQNFREELARALENFSIWLPRLLYAGVVVYTGYRILSMVAGYYRAVGDLMNL